MRREERAETPEADKPEVITIPDSSDDEQENVRPPSRADIIRNQDEEFLMNQFKDIEIKKQKELREELKNLFDVGILPDITMDRIIAAANQLDDEVLKKAVLELVRLVVEGDREDFNYKRKILHKKSIIDLKLGTKLRVGEYLRRGV